MTGVYSRLRRLEQRRRELDALVDTESVDTEQSVNTTPELLEFIPQLSAKWIRPDHLAPVARLFERAFAGEALRAVISLPPRHGKTELLLHAIVWWLAQNPEARLAYASAGADIARKKSGRARTLAQRAGVRLSQSSHSKSDWRTLAGDGDGGLWACGAAGQLNGEGFDCLIVDDPHKGRAEAESQVIRDRIYAWLKADALNRLEPNGSIVVCHTRWHPDDVAGRLIGEGWENVTLPAINARGEALWPDRWPIDRLLARQRELGGPNGYDWVSLYQGQPQPSGTALFQDVAYYDEVPVRHAMRIVIGIDFGYSKNRGDYSTAVVLGEYAGSFYVLEVLRIQVEPRVFRDRVLALCEQWGTRTVASFIAPTERGGLEFLREGGLHVLEYRSPGKLPQALSVSAAWNTKKVLCPNPEKLPEPWLDKLIAEVRGFTGLGDRHDDQVDALAGAYEVIKLQTIDWSLLDDLRAAIPKPLELF